MTLGSVGMARILVADDDEEFRFVLCAILRKAGHEVLEAGDGLEALRGLADHRVSLLVTDLLMPQKEGLETIIEARLAQPSLRVLAISGGGFPAGVNLPAARALGADDTLSKPFRPQELVEAVDRLLA